MGSDRSLVLSQRAYAAGLIDFSKSRFDDPAWWRRVRFILDELSAQIDLDHAKIRHQHNVALVGSLPDPELNMQFLKDAWESFNGVTQSIYPWFDYAVVEKREHDAIAEQYNQSVGDMNDPAYRKQVDLMVQELNERRLKSIQSNMEREEAAKQLALSRAGSRFKNRKR